MRISSDIQDGAIDRHKRMCVNECPIAKMLLTLPVELLDIIVKKVRSVEDIDGSNQADIVVAIGPRLEAAEANLPFIGTFDCASHFLSSCSEYG